MNVWHRFALAALAASVGASTPANPAAAFKAKLGAIQTGRARPGSVFIFSPVEVNAYVRSELPTVAPQGVLRVVRKAQFLVFEERGGFVVESQKVSTAGQDLFHARLEVMTEQYRSGMQ